MALVVHWYDLFCLALVLGAIVGSLLVIREGECGCNRKNHSMYESLLIARNELSDLHGTGHIDSVQLWKSCWRGLHPAWLLVFRLISVVILTGIILSDIGIYDLSIMLYYTEWTFTLVIIYFAIATLISAHGCWISSKQHASENEEINEFLKRDGEETRTATVTSTENHNSDASKLRNYYERRDNARKAGHLGYIMQIIYQTSAGAVMLTDVVFWGLLVPFMSSEHFSLNSVMVCMHSLNAVFLLLDTFLNSLPFPRFRMAYFVLLSCIYVTFQWVLHACGFSWWPYPFLELETPWAPLWYFGVALVHIPCYGFYCLVVQAKDTFFSKLFSHAFIKPY